MGAIGTKMKIGSRVKHPRLGEGIVLELRKYGGVMIDFSGQNGTLVRVCHISSLEVIHE